MDIESDTSTEIDFFSESADSIDNLLESMDEQINDLYEIVRTQKEEIDKLTKTVESLKSILKSHLAEHLNKILDFI